MPVKFLAYRLFAGAVNTARVAILAVPVLGLGFGSLGAAGAMADPMTIVALGDSLTAGHGLVGIDATFPARLEQALVARGLDVRVINAGVSGDTSAGGISRLAWSMAGGVDLAIVELGANDALRGLDPGATFSNLDEILGWLAAEGIPVVLAGMLAPPNLGDEYGRAFNSIYLRLAEAHAIALYPFFLEGVATRAALLQDDGMHPNADGVEVIVNGILPVILSVLEGGAGSR